VLTVVDYYVAMQSAEGYEYEITVTFDSRKIWNKTSVWYEGIKEAIAYVLDGCVVCQRGNNGWTPDLVQLAVSMEYSKKGDPHLHFRLVTRNECDYRFREKLWHGLSRNFGRTTFQLVRDTPAFLDYLCKEIDSNYTKHGFEHAKIFFP